MNLTQARVAILLGWAVLTALGARPLTIGLELLRRPAAIRAETNPWPAATPMAQRSGPGSGDPGSAPASGPATAPYGAGFAHMAQLIAARRLAWEADRQARLESAAERQPAGIALVALATALLVLWAWLAWRMWKSPLRL